MATSLNSQSSIRLEPIFSDGPKVAYHAAVSFNNSIYLHGGLNNKNDKLPSNQLYKFDFKTGWQNITPLESPALSHHCAFIQENHVIIVGGWNGSSRISDVYIYDISQNKFTKAKTKGFPSGSGLSSHTCTLLSDNSIAIFGREGSLRHQRKYGNSYLLKGSPLTALYSYEELPIDCASRSGHVTLGIDKAQILVYGGRKDKDLENHRLSPFEYNSRLKNIKIENFFINVLNSKEGVLCKKPPGGRRFSIACKLDDFLLIHGGETFDSNFREPVGDFLAYHFPSQNWYSFVTTDLIGLQNHSISILEDRLIIHGGIGAKNLVNSITYEVLF